MRAENQGIPGIQACDAVSRKKNTVPKRAISEPTDRSIPPEMITRPIPKLNIPYMPICRAIFSMFLKERNRDSIRLWINPPASMFRENRMVQKEMKSRTIAKQHSFR